MALNVVTFKADLKSDFISLFTDFLNQDSLGLTAQQKSDQNNKIDQIADAWADKLSARIDAYIRTGTVNTTVTVASVSGVTTGVGVSGPGSGSGTGAIT